MKASELKENKDVKEIRLTRGFVALVDSEDFDRISGFKWYASSSIKQEPYAIRSVYEGGSYKHVHMHREIMNAPHGLVVDHKNHNSLDNRKSNLRLATTRENTHNQRKPKDNTSGFKGVYWDKRKKKWRARLINDGRFVELGYFLDIEKAAKAYDEAAKKYHGLFAHINGI